MIFYTIANVIMHVVLMATLVSIFFFFYGSLIEEKVITSQVDNLISDITIDLKAVLSDSDKNAIMEAFKNLQPPDMSVEDKNASDQNKKLMIKAAKIVGITLIIGLVVSGILAFMFNFSYIDMIKENIVILIVACAVEFFFLSFFAKNYRSLDPNMVKLTVIKTLQSYANS